MVMLALKLERVNVLEVGIEPTCLATANFKSAAYTSSATRALRPRRESNPRIEILQISELPLFYVAGL
jgi:hypothetical protein